MPIVPSIIINNNTPNTAAFSITDSSTGSDDAITSIQFIITDSSSNPVLNSPYIFAYTANATYNITGLPQDVAINVVANFLNNVGAVLYTTSGIAGLTGYLEWFAVSLVQQIQAKQSITSDTNFISNSFWLRVLIDDVYDSINNLQSITAAENCISMAQFLVNNENDYF